MPDGLEFSFDARQLDRDAERAIRHYLAAGTEAVATTTKALERRIEAGAQSAVPGRLWRAIKSQSFPRRGAARNPVGTVFVNGGARSRGAIKFWSQPGAIRGKSGQYLAIPLPAAGPRGRARDLSPGEWERRTGLRLQFVYRPGRASLLVAKDAVLSGKGRIARGNTQRRIAAGRGSATVPIFVLLPMVPFRNAFAIEPMVAQAEGELVEAFLRGVGKSF